MGLTRKVEFYKKRQFGEKINATFYFIRENAWPYLKVQMMISGPILLIANIIINQSAFDFFGFTGDFTANMMIDIFQLYGMVLLMAIVTTTIMPAVTYGYMVAYQDNDPSDITVAKVVSGFSNRFFNILGFNILFYIVVIIGFFFFILPGIFLAVVLTLGTSIIVFEKNNPIDAFGRSFTLIRGKWWSTFGILFVMTIIGYIISMFFGLPRTILFGMKMFTSFEDTGDFGGIAEMSDTDQVLNILFSVFETFGNILLYSLSYIAIAFQYFNLVERRESRGLVAKIEQMDEVGGEEEADEDY